MIVRVIEMISEFEIIRGMPVCVDMPSPVNSEMYVWRLNFFGNIA